MDQDGMPTYEAEEQDRRERAERELRAACGAEVADAVIDGEAFGAVAYWLDQAVQDGLDPQDVLGLISSEDLEFTLRADDPAAFMASRVKTAYYAL